MCMEGHMQHITNIHSSGHIQGCLGSIVCVLNSLTHNKLYVLRLSFVLTLTKHSYVILIHQRKVNTANLWLNFSLWQLKMSKFSTSEKFVTWGVFSMFFVLEVFPLFSLPLSWPPFCFSAWLWLCPSCLLLWDQLFTAWSPDWSRDNLLTHQDCSDLYLLTMLGLN